MEIQVEQGVLAKALNIVSRTAAGAKTTLPILNNVLIRADDGKVSLTTTNLNMAVVEYLPTSKAENGVITVPARLLTDFISALPSDEVTIKSEDSKVVITSGKYRSVINGTLADNYPELPGMDESKAVIFKMNVAEFKVGMAKVKLGASTDTSRPVLTGVNFHTNNGALYIAATDGYRIIEERFIEKVSSEVKATVPVSTINELLSALNDEAEEIEFLFDESQVRFRFGGIEMTSKLIDGSYPDFSNLIPDKVGCEIRVNRSELLRVVKIAALFSRGSGGAVICEADEETQKLVISSVANEFGENSSEIEAAVKNKARIAFNSKYMIDAISCFDSEELFLGFNEKMQPVLLKDEKDTGYVHVLMPIHG